MRHFVIVFAILMVVIPIAFAEEIEPGWTTIYPVVSAFFEMTDFDYYEEYAYIDIDEMALKIPLDKFQYYCAKYLGYVPIMYRYDGPSLVEYPISILLRGVNELDFKLEKGDDGTLYVVTDPCISNELIDYSFPWYNYEKMEYDFLKFDELKEYLGKFYDGYKFVHMNYGQAEIYQYEPDNYIKLKEGRDFYVEDTYYVTTWWASNFAYKLTVMAMN